MFGFGRDLRIIALLLLAFLVFGPSIAGGFSSDDHALIEGDVRVADPERVIDLLTTPLWSFDFDDPTTDAPYARVHRPLVKLAFVAGHRIGGGAPWAFHVLAVCVHLLVVALAFRFLERRGLSVPAVFAGAVVFAVHPTRLESVAWVSGMSDTLMAAFALSSAECVSALGRTAPAARLRRVSLIALTVVAAFSSAASKEVGLIAAPALVWFESMTASTSANDVPRRAWLVPVAASIVGASSAIAVAAYVGRDLPGNPIRLDLLRPVAALGAAFERIVIPLPMTLDPYPLRFDSSGMRIVPRRELVVGVTVLAAMFVTFGAALRRRSLVDLAAPLGLFALTLAPTLGIEGRRAPGLLYDRFLYLPLLGISWFVGSAIDRFPISKRRVAGLVVVALIVSSVPTVHASVLLFGDEHAWYAHEARLHPDDPMLCTATVRDAVNRRDYPRASTEMSRCLRLARAQHRKSLEASLVLGRVATRLLETPDREIAETRGLRDAMTRFHATGELEAKVDERLLRLHVERPLLLEARNHAELVQLPIAALSIRLREFDVALRWSGDALRTYRRMPDAWLTHLTALARAGRFAEARRVVREARSAVPGEAAYLDGFEQALSRAEGIARDGSLPPEERAPAVADALQDPYGVLLADHDRCEAAVSPQVTARCVRSALALRDPATAIRYLELRAVVAPDERPVIDRAIRSLSERR